MQLSAKKQLSPFLKTPNPFFKNQRWGAHCWFQMKKKKGRKRTAHITFLFLWVQFAWHFFDSTQALKMAASLFRNTETQNKTKALKNEARGRLPFPAIRGKLLALQWTEAECYSGVQLTITAELSTFSKWKGSNVEKRQTLGWLTVLNVRNEPERYEHCTQMKTQTLPDTGVRIKTIHLFKQTHGMRHRGSLSDVHVWYSHAEGRWPCTSPWWQRTSRIWAHS